MTENFGNFFQPLKLKYVIINGKMTFTILYKEGLNHDKR